MSRIRHIRFVILIPSLLLLSASPTLAESEREAYLRLAPKYNASHDVHLSDGSFADLVSDEYAFEVDWAPKWQQSIGQAALYALLTGKKPAIILLVSDAEKEKRYIDRCRKVCESVWSFYSPKEHPVHIELFVETAAYPPEPTLAPPKPKVPSSQPYPRHNPWKNEGGEKCRQGLVADAYE